jgi:hypothetical protein
MSDTITQTRLSMRLDNYLREYTGRSVKTDTMRKQEWDVAWKAAELARANSNLTPEIVDDVRVALNKL